MINAPLLRIAGVHFSDTWMLQKLWYIKCSATA
jgi:hypothetical protein